MQGPYRETSNENVEGGVRRPGGCSTRALLTAMKDQPVRCLMLRSLVGWLSMILLLSHKWRQQLPTCDGLTGIATLEVICIAIQATALVTAPMHLLMLLPLLQSGQEDAESKI